MASNWFTYIVECCDGTLYTGITTDLERRLQEHNHSPKGARYTRVRRPVHLVYSQSVDDRRSASQLEYQIKQLPVAEKRALCCAISA